jgi:hypothetical protein
LQKPFNIFNTYYEIRDYKFDIKTSNTCLHVVVVGVVALDKGHLCCPHPMLVHNGSVHILQFGGFSRFSKLRGILLAEEGTVQREEEADMPGATQRLVNSLVGSCSRVHECDVVAQACWSEMVNLNQTKSKVKKTPESLCSLSGLWIRIRIGSGFRDFVDPDPYWESGSGSRGKKTKKFQWKKCTF